MSSRAAEIIRNRKQEIVDRWLDKVRDEIPEARQESTPVIRDSVPDLLDSISEALASDDARKVVHESDQHGQERAILTEYTIDQVVREYRLLKQTIFSITDEQGDNLETRERDGIMYAIDQAVEQAAAVFARTHIENNQQAIEAAEKLLQELEARDELRDQFVATLSHDIRTPLGNTLQLAKLLEKHLESSDDGFIQKALKGIRLSANQGNKLISNLMDVSLIQSGNPIPLNKSQSNLLEAVRHELESMKPSLRERVIIDSKQSEVIGHWDVEALLRAINNLISNAVKYGSIEEAITLTIQQDSQHTTIAVQNYGNPIPPEKVDKLFDLYYRTGDNKAKGWGLGLTLVKGIVELHDGTIDVSSDIEEGTTFTIRIANRS